jgi:WD40 repeat protein
MLRTWDLSGKETYVRQTARLRDSPVFEQADLAPDGDLVAYRWLDDGKGWVRFVDTVTGDTTPPTRLPVTEAVLSYGALPLGAWDPQGRRYVSYGCDDPCKAGGVVTVLDSTGRLVRRQKIGDGEVFALEYVAGGRSVLVGHGDNYNHSMTSIVDAETLLPRGERVDVSVNCCASPIGEPNAAMLWENSPDGEFAHWRVLDVDSGEVLPEGGEVDSFAYFSIASPDGSSVAVGGWGQIATVDVATAGRRGVSTGVGAEVLWLDWSDDGELLVSGAADGAVSTWDADTLDLLGTLHPSSRGEPAPVGVQFIGDTHDVVIASYDGRVYQWDTDVDQAVDYACQMAGRDLTEEEWAEFLPAQPYRSVCPQD